MSTAWWITMVLLAAGVFFMYLPLSLDIQADLDMDAAELHIKLSIFKIPLYRYQKKIVFHQGDVDTAKSAKGASFITVIGRNALDYITILDWLRKIFVVKLLKWKSVVGTGDAAFTGFTVGFVYMIKNLLVEWVTRKISFREVPDLHIAPDYAEQKLQTTIHCILNSRLGKATYAAIRMYIWLQRRGEHGRSSDSIPDVHHA